MKKSGLIIGTTVIVDTMKLGYQGHLSLYIKVNKEQIEEFIKFLEQIPEAAPLFQVELNKDYNFHILFPIKNMKEIEEKKKQIKKHPSVISVRTNIWTKIATIEDNFSKINS